MAEQINIEVIYALPQEQILYRMLAPQGTTVVEAVKLSGVLEKHPEIDLDKNKLGVFGKLTRTDAILRDRDRVEIYRPLLADPKEIRRRRAAEGKAMKKDNEA
jgi:hypothetical protein